jgi:ribosomal protein L11 methyltransferase
LQEMLAGAPADLLLCNILAPVLTALTPAFADLLTARGEGLLSGLLVDQSPALIAHLEAHGWQVRSEAEQGRWALLAIQRTGAEDI